MTVTLPLVNLRYRHEFRRTDKFSHSSVNKTLVPSMDAARARVTLKMSGHQDVHDGMFSRQSGDVVRRPLAAGYSPAACDRLPSRNACQLSRPVNEEPLCPP